MSKVSVLLKDQKIVRVDIEDHAGYARKGEDIVCAGISAISIGALNALSELFGKYCSLRMDPKTVTIHIEVIGDCPDLQVCLSFMLIQLETIREQYPDYLTIERKEIS